MLSLGLIKLVEKDTIMNYRPISEAYKWNVEFLIRSRGISKYTVQRYLKIIPAKWSEFDLRSHGWKHIACEYSSLFCVVSCLKHYMGTSIMSWIDRDIPILIYLQIYEAEILTSTDTLYTLGDKGYNGDHSPGATLQMMFIASYSGQQPDAPDVQLSGQPTCECGGGGGNPTTVKPPPSTGTWPQIGFDWLNV